jgi:hypothetical protein
MNTKLIACALLAGLLPTLAAAADLVLYDEGNFQGRPVSVVIDMRQLGTLNFDDRASSVVVEKGAWVLCTEADFSGTCITLEPGRYSSLKDLGLENGVTSVRRRDEISLGVFN